MKPESPKDMLSSRKSQASLDPTPANLKSEPRVLHLTLKKEWFDMIASGQKKEEYREAKPYWVKRLTRKDFDVVKFRNGYRPDSPTVTVKLLCIRIGLGKVEWGAPAVKHVFILGLGEILSTSDNPNPGESK